MSHRDNALVTARKPPARRKPGPKPTNAVVPPATTKEEREKRDFLIVARCLAGQSESEIARAVGITPQRVHQILRREMKNAARHHQLLREEALGMWINRSEALLQACWPGVIRKDLKAVDMARKIQKDQADIYGLTAQRPAGAIPPMPLLGDGDEGDVDELTRYRQQRKRPDEQQAQ